MTNLPGGGDPRDIDLLMDSQSPENADNGLDDLECLKYAFPNIPDTAKEKDLRACTICRLIMSDKQW